MGSPIEPGERRAGCADANVAKRQESSHRPDCPAVNPGLASFWNGLILLNRLSGGRPADAKEEADRRGWSGALNVEVTGADGGTWHFQFQDGRVAILRGAAAEPRATIRLPPAALFQMLAGQATMFSLTLTGAVSTTGEGLSTMVLWTSISRLRALARARGPLALAIGWWLRRVLARSGSGLTLGGDA